MKRKLAALLIVTMLLCLVGCEQKQNYNPNLPKNVLNGLLAMDKALDDYLEYNLTPSELAEKLKYLADRVESDPWLDNYLSESDRFLFYDKCDVSRICIDFGWRFIGFDSLSDSEKNRLISDNIDKWKQDIADVLYEK